MSDSVIYHSQVVVPPTQTRVWVLPVTTTTGYVDLWKAYANADGSESLPQFLAGRYITIRAQGSNIFYCLSTVNNVAITTPGSTSFTDPSAAAGVPIADGEQRAIFVPRKPPVGKTGLRYFAAITSTGSATLYLWPSSGTGRASP